MVRRKDVFNIENENHTWTVIEEPVKFPKQKHGSITWTRADLKLPVAKRHTSYPDMTSQRENDCSANAKDRSA